MVANNTSLLENWKIFFTWEVAPIRSILSDATQLGQMLVILLLHLLVRCHCIYAAECKTEGCEEPTDFGYRNQ